MKASCSRTHSEPLPGLLTDRELFGESQMSVSNGKHLSEKSNSVSARIRVFGDSWWILASCFWALGASWLFDYIYLYRYVLSFILFLLHPFLYWSKIKTCSQVHTIQRFKVKNNPLPFLPTIFVRPYRSFMWIIYTLWPSCTFSLFCCNLSQTSRENLKRS